MSKYFNFPVELLSGFINNTEKVLSNILDYCLAYYMQQYNESLDEAAEYYKISLGNPQATLRNGQALLSSTTDKRLTGLNLQVFWDFHDHRKSGFDKVVLLAFLAAKSMIGSKQYYKLTCQDMWLARMLGKPDNYTIHKEDEIAAYCSRYKFTQVKVELQTSYKLVIYSYHTRGQYISTTLSVEQLAKIAESRKQNYRHRQLQSRARAAHEAARRVVEAEQRAEEERLSNQIAEDEQKIKEVWFGKQPEQRAN